jgi:hypothetical protein
VNTNLLPAIAGLIISGNAAPVIKIRGHGGEFDPDLHPNRGTWIRAQLGRGLQDGYDELLRLDAFVTSRTKFPEGNVDKAL